MQSRIFDEKNWLKKAKHQAELDRELKAIRSEYKKELYSKQVLKMYNDYEELVFNLSEQTANETIESIKNMSHGQRLKLQELITKRNRAQIQKATPNG